ncbi:MAG TPA: TlpA disulfide reductase family protein [Candidatus Acidoferrales bacterium]|jgi:thiol-disulfide isomerase/thioredoxin|nr:TlpA disulfide reductase family protein [Candidatus Acidoferrales bacterium]
MALCLGVVLAIGSQTVSAQTPAPAAAPKKAEKVDFAPELAQVTTDLKAKFDAKTTSGTDLEENLKAINDLIVKHQTDGNREQLARLYLLDAHIYADGLTNSARARAIWVKVARDFPGTMAAQGATLSLTKLNAKESSEPDPSIPEGLEVGQKFPGFSETDVAGNPLSVQGYRGKVTMIDFWATWCGPCKAEMPNVIATYNKYRAQGFDIIGISLDDDKAALMNFTPAHGMAWAQFFDGQGWKNKLATKYGVHSIPMDYLLDRHGIIIGKELRGEQLSEAVAKAVGGM